jgi:hypothetical protein
MGIRLKLTGKLLERKFEREILMLRWSVEEDKVESTTTTRIRRREEDVERRQQGTEFDERNAWGSDIELKMLPEVKNGLASDDD